MSLKLKLGEIAHDLSLLALQPVLVTEIDGTPHRLAEVGGNGTDRRIVVDDRLIDYRQARSGNTVFLHLHGRLWTVEFVDPRDAARAESAGSDEIRAPMPGAVISIEKQPGEAVRMGETVLTIESMKLQTNLSAPRDGVLGAILKEVGSTFDKDEVVAVMESEDA